MTQYLRSPAEMISVRDALPPAPEVVSALSGQDAYRYTVAVGLALRGSSADYAEAPALDLSAGDSVIVERRMAPRALLASACATGVILIGTVATALVLGNAIATGNLTLRQRRAEVALLKGQYDLKVTQLERQKNLTETIRVSAKPIREGLDFFSASFARRAALVGVNLDEKGGVYLSGEAPSPRAIADIIDIMNLSPMLQPMRLVNMIRIDPRSGHGLKFDLQTGFIKQPAPQTAEQGAPARAAAAGSAQGGS
jgi:hypothetical protein